MTRGIHSKVRGIGLPEIRGTMNTRLWLGIAGTIVLLGFISLGCNSALAASEPAPPAAGELLTVGTAGPKAIGLTITTDRSEGHVFRPGDSLTVHAKTDRRAYLTAIYVSSKGDAIILFPNHQSPDSLLLPGKDYTLFGESTSIKLKVSDTMKEGRIAFFASPSPLSLESVGAYSETLPCIRIPAAARDRLAVLKRMLETASKEEGFNRVVLALKGGGGEGLSLNLMGLPGTVQSEQPETVTGVQGMKEGAIKDR
jgi:hypothetical protein